jgi:hypothetical protein
MVWFELMANDGLKHMVNAASIMSVHYNPKTDMTVIECLRSGFPVFYAHGNIMSEMRKALTNNEHDVIRIGD